MRKRVRDLVSNAEARRLGGEASNMANQHEMAHPNAEEQLRHILSIVDGHVKFAETKNAALLAANSALIIGAIQVLTPYPTELGFLHRIGMYAATLCLIAAAFSIVSFLPLRSRPYLWKQRRVSENDNLLFFEEIQKHSETSYFRAFLDANDLPNREAIGLERMYVNQIVINAKLASSKFAYFEYAAWITLTGVLTPVAIGLALGMAQYKRRLEAHEAV
jgi:hypothetical protein